MLSRVAAHQAGAFLGVVFGQAVGQDGPGLIEDAHRIAPFEGPCNAGYSRREQAAATLQRLCRACIDHQLTLQLQNYIFPPTWILKGGRIG